MREHRECEVAWDNDCEHAPEITSREMVAICAQRKET